MVYNKTDKVIAKQQSIKDKIIEAAKEIIAEGNTGSTSVKAIAQKAGIATGTFYLYFRNKEALIDTIVKELYAQLLEKIKTARAGRPDILAKLQVSMEVCIGVFMKEKHIARILLLYLPEINTTLSTKFTAIEKDLIRFAQKDIEALIAGGLIPEQDAQVSATALVGAFRQVILSWMSGNPPQDWEKACRTLIDYNLRGLGKHGLSSY